MTLRGELERGDHSDSNHILRLHECNVSGNWLSFLNILYNKRTSKPLLLWKSRLNRLFFLHVGQNLSISLFFFHLSATALHITVLYPLYSPCLHLKSQTLVILGDAWRVLVQFSTLSKAKCLSSAVPVKWPRDCRSFHKCASPGLWLSLSFLDAH